MELREYIPVTGPPNIWAELGFPNEDAQLREQVMNGLPIKVLYLFAFLDGGNPDSMRDTLRIPSTTFQRRKRDSRFTMNESNRLYSLIEVFSRATDLFEGDRKAAVEWITKKVRGLGHKRLINMLDNRANTLAVLDLIARLEREIYS
ncbi:antitoxin Xre/MbcA/ParS toxin-binding domain-containing protein [Idiomarina xiamenensis]|uniref:Antitoxin Xre/MbcA/ParS-like toxin-binding domain-containing protein n=1 Tax=Idiomarina xiamenensis 10-D-4 TaxID=740709 RepID=K2KPD3_9GAMM|nr:antitoxin Xre/MbcA/ParS toxin-binding domain-containing protein [Idiomarina xiamenensis]EKE84249.1 hypothetical protein A10D4_06136 [Idiomarina xiamenensis 10-D-4]